MLQSEYDFYCMVDDVWIRKENTPIPQFLDGESIVRMLDSDWRAMRLDRVALCDLIITDRRIMFVTNGQLDSEILLSDVLQARTGFVSKPISAYVLMIELKQSRSISISLANLSVFQERDTSFEERRLIEDLSNCIDRIVKH